MLKYLKRLFKKKPVQNVTVVKYFFTSEESIKWTQVDSWSLNSFMSTDTGKKLVNILNDSVLCKKMEVTSEKTANAIIYNAGMSDGMIAAILKIKSLCVPQPGGLGDSERDDDI